jgi:oligoribonuclease
MIGVFLDTETSGLNPFKHVPLEIALCLVDLFSGKELASFQTFMKVSDEEWAASDPIALKINGLKKEDLLHGVKREEAASAIEEIFRHFDISRDRAYFICQNPSFDRPFFAQIIPPYRQESLRLPYHWLDLASMYWAQFLVKKQKQSEFFLSVSKDSIAQEFGIPPEKSPHRAMNGVLHLLECYRKLVGFPMKDIF